MICSDDSFGKNRKYQIGIVLRGRTFSQPARVNRYCNEWFPFKTGCRQVFEEQQIYIISKSIGVILEVKTRILEINVRERGWKYRYETLQTRYNWVNT